MKGRDGLLSAFKAEDLTELEAGAKALADPAASRERAAIFIMVELLIWCCGRAMARGVPTLANSKVPLDDY
jgi:hypothetical protein